MIVLVFCSMMGAFGAQFKAKNGDTHLYLYKATGGSTVTYYTDISWGCGDIDRNFDASLTFAILAWLVILVATALAVISLFKAIPFLPAFSGIVLAAVTWFFLLISWTLVAALNHEHYCGTGGFHSGYHYDYGFAFLVIAWICTMFWGAFELLIFLGFMPSKEIINTSSTTAAKA